MPEAFLRLLYCSTVVLIAKWLAAPAFGVQLSLEAPHYETIYTTVAFSSPQLVAITCVSSEYSFQMEL